MTRSVRSRIVRTGLLAMSMVIVARVITSLMGWSFLYVSLILLSGTTLVLLWLKSRRRKRAQYAAESRPDAERKV
jgi:Flp pilus assembly protein TadB